MTIGNTCRSFGGGLALCPIGRGRSRRSSMIAGLLILSLCACAPLTEHERFDRENRLNLAKEEYLQKEADCRRVGGAMQMQATPLSKNGRHDYMTARCVAL